MEGYHSEFFSVSYYPSEYFPEVPRGRWLRIQVRFSAKQIPSQTSLDAMVVIKTTSKQIITAKVKAEMLL